MTAPPIPQRLAALPQSGGLAVPYISMPKPGTPGAFLLGEMHGAKAGECIVNYLCQIDGKPLGPKPWLFLGTQRAIDDGFSAEPALHPECAAYSARACPMLNGSMATYAKRERTHDGEPCSEAGCDCGGWVTAPQSGRAGEPAEPWFQIWVRGHAIGIREPGPLTVGNVTGAVFKNQIIKTRPIHRNATTPA